MSEALAELAAALEAAKKHSAQGRANLDTIGEALTAAKDEIDEHLDTLRGIIAALEVTRRGLAEMATQVEEAAGHFEEAEEAVEEAEASHDIIEAEEEEEGEEE